jgi:hypothetical protein
MKMKYFLILVYILLFGNLLLGQASEAKPDVVYLKNGSIFKGEILDYHPDKQLKLELSNSGIIITLESKKVKKIIQGDVDSVNLKRVERPYHFREKGFYNATYVMANAGGSAFDVTETNYGFGVQTSFGYQFHRLLGVGVGIGMDYYYKGSGENFMPVFGEVRGYLFSKKWTPTYSFAVGHGFAFKDEDRNITQADGGWMILPAIGIRMGGAKTMNFTLDAGVKIQKGKFEFTNWEVTEHRMTYRRLVVRAGFIF